MSISTESIKNTVISGATTAYEVSKQAVIWLGRQITTGFSTYILPTMKNMLPIIKNLWSAAIAGFVKIGQFVKTPHGMAFAASAALFVTGKSLIDLTKSDKYEDRPALKTAIITLGIVAIAAGTLATGIAVSVLPVI